ncbi:hypothetical protein MXB_2665, partial [Myxobolus squamalis]
LSQKEHCHTEPFGYRECISMFRKAVNMRKIMKSRIKAHSLVPMREAVSMAIKTLIRYVMLNSLVSFINFEFMRQRIARIVTWGILRQAFIRILGIQFSYLWFDVERIIRFQTSNLVIITSRTNNLDSDSPRTPLSTRQQAKLVEKLSRSDPTHRRGGKNPSYKRNIKGETSLHRAAIRGNIIKMAEIIHEYSNVDVLDYAGWTPLLEAANRGNYEAVMYLINRGANINFLGPSNVTPLHDACYNDKIDVIKLLILQGANLDIPDDSGLTCRHYINTNPVILQKISKIVDINSIEIQNSDSHQPLIKGLPLSFSPIPPLRAILDDNSIKENLLYPSKIEKCDLNINFLSPIVHVQNNTKHRQHENKTLVHVANLNSDDSFNLKSKKSVVAHDYESKLNSSYMYPYLADDWICRRVWDLHINRKTLGDFLLEGLYELFTIEGLNKLISLHLSSEQKLIEKHSITLIVERITVLCREKYLLNFYRLVRDHYASGKENTFNSVLVSFTKNILIEFRRNFHQIFSKSDKDSKYSHCQ